MTWVIPCSSRVARFFATASPATYRPSATRVRFSKKSNFRRRIWSSDSGAASSRLSRKASRFRPIGRLDPAGAPTPRLRPATPAAGLPLELAGEGSLELEGASPSRGERGPKPGGFRAVRGVTFDPGAAPDGATAPRFSPSPSPGGFPSAGTAPARGEMDPEGLSSSPGTRMRVVVMSTSGLVLTGHFAEAHGRQEVVRVRVRSGRVHVEPVAVHPTIVRVHRVARHPFGGPHARRSLRESRQSTTMPITVLPGETWREKLCRDLDENLKTGPPAGGPTRRSNITTPSPRRSPRPPSRPSQKVLSAGSE